jgi:hypothetical protein
MDEPGWPANALSGTVMVLVATPLGWVVLVLIAGRLI